MTLRTELLEAEEEYPYEWFDLAYAEAERQNKRKWSYIRGILKDWKENGVQSGENESYPSDFREDAQRKAKEVIAWQNSDEAQAMRIRQAAMVEELYGKGKTA